MPSEAVSPIAPRLPPQRRMRRWLVPVAILALLITGVGLAIPFRIWYVAHRIEIASTPAEEGAALSVLRRWTCYYDGGLARFYTKEDVLMENFVFSHDPEKFDKVGYIEIEWRWGIKVKRKLLATEHLDFLLGG